MPKWLTIEPFLGIDMKEMVKKHLLTLLYVVAQLDTLFESNA